MNIKNYNSMKNKYYVHVFNFLSTFVVSSLASFLAAPDRRGIAFAIGFVLCATVNLMAILLDSHRGVTFIICIATGLNAGLIKTKEAFAKYFIMIIFVIFFIKIINVFFINLLKFTSKRNKL